ncbi:TPA: hypothetical protein ACGCOB_005125, partial [Escherichia coli]
HFCELNHKQGFSANINIYKVRYIMCVFYAVYCYYPYFLQNNILITLSISDSVPFLFQETIHHIAGEHSLRGNGMQKLTDYWQL